MNILITGIHGHVGLNLARALKGEHTIYGLDLIHTEIEGVTRIYSCAEMMDIPHMDVVIHLAGKFVETNDLSHALEYFEENAGLARQTFKWFVQSSAKTFIFLSSVKAVADHVQGLALTEDVEPKPFGALGESKLLAEKYILEQYVVDKKVYVLRPCIIHGYGSLGNKNMNWLYKWVKKGYPFPFGKYQCYRSFTSVDNLSFILKQILKKNIPSGIYNVSDDGCLTLSEIYEIMGVALGRKVFIWNISKSFVKLASKVSSRFNDYFDDYQYQKLSTDFVVSNEKIKKALAIDKMPVSIVDGLTKSILEYKE